MPRSSVQGLPELQAWFAGELASVSPADVTPAAPRDVFIVPGTQSGLSSIFRALARTGNPVIMESPTYWGAILAAQQAQVRIVPVISDADGPDPEDLSRVFSETGARLFYAQPTFANPAGGQWSASKREKILAVVREHGAFLIEDDWARDFSIDPAASPLAAFDDSGHVIYVRSLTKSVSPSIRVGAIIARGPVRERLLADRAAESMYVSGLLQSAALDVVLHPAWRTHLRRLKDQLRERRNLLADSISEYMPSATIDRLPQGGLNLWVRLPEEIQVEQLVRDCENEGVLIASGSDWFPADPSGKFIRVNFSGPNPFRFPEAAKIIGKMMTRQLN